MSTLNLIKEIKTNNTDYLVASTELDNLTTETNKKYIKDVLNKFREFFIKFKIQYIVGEFSGGHDEGGFDSTYFENDNNKEIIPDTSVNKDSFIKWINVENIHTFENEKQKKTTFYSTITSKKINILEELEDILYKAGCLEEYGSFAGEFSVNGTVKLNVFTGKWKRNGQETLETYQYNNNEGEI
jgi:hypothetical protein